MTNNTAEKLEKLPLRKLFLVMAVPSVLAQLINVLYNIVDRIYIGHIKEVGSLALTGVGVTFPIIMVVSAFSAFAGQGGAPLASIELGEFYIILKSFDCEVKDLDQFRKIIFK